MTFDTPLRAEAGLRDKSRSYLALIFLFWSLIYASSIFSPALLDDADSVHAEAAREMTVRGDWVTLHVNGFRYLEKAPLMYWTIAASFKLFGVSEWAARLPLTLGVLALLFAVFALGRRIHGAEAGFYAALSLGTAVGPYLFTRILIPDILVGLWLALGLGFFLRTLEEERPSRLACWSFAVIAALSVLTKGLIGLLFPLGIIGLYLLLTRNLRRLLRMRPLTSSLIFLAVAAPWHILAGLRNPPQGEAKGFLWFYFINEQFLRYLNKREPHDYGTVPLWVFWGLVLVWLLPWSAFIAQPLGQLFRKLDLHHAKLDTQRRANLLFALWAGVILVFFSFSTSQEYYNLPALPGLALLIGSWLAQEAKAGASSPLCRSGRISSLALLIVGALAGAFAIFFVVRSAPPPPGADIAELLTKNPEKYFLSFGHIFDLTPRSLGAFRGPLLGMGLSFLIGTGLNWMFRHRGQPARGNLCLALMMVVALLCAHRGLEIFAPVLSSKELALAIQRRYSAGEQIVINGEYEEGSTLNFYTGLQARILNGRRANLWYGSLFPDSPQIFEDDESFARLWSGPARVYLWTDRERMPKLLRDGNLTNVYEIARSGGKFIISNKPMAAQSGRDQP